MTYKQTTVLVQCTAPSHDGAIPVRRFGVSSRDGEPWSWGATTDQTLIDDTPLDDETTKRMHGTVLNPPDQTLLMRESRRLRWSLECPGCGLRVDMKRETAERLIVGVANAGVFEIDLAAVAANL